MPLRDAGSGRLGRPMCGKARPFRESRLIISEAMPPLMQAEAEPRKKNRRWSESHRLSAPQAAQPLPFIPGLSNGERYCLDVIA